ncbi:sigma 54-interacting transcriptional regulator [Domibacillus sp. 8LH]|uniref:sigma-54 interaction domain-containing protein n=1 Tax=Domibacillus sp. 8LH TaxID=3073900 RepID=UPI003170248D
MERITFQTVHPDTAAADAGQQLANCHCIVIQKGENYYTIEQHEAGLLSDEGTIGEWLERNGWLPSSAVQAEGEGDWDWRRPVLYVRDNGIDQIVTPAMRIRLLTGYFHTLAETINDSVTAVDREGTVLFWNTTAEETYGISRGKIIGQKIGDHFQAESVVLNSVLQHGQNIRGEYHRPNETNHVLINASPVVIDGNIAGGIATEHDITNMMKLNDELDSALPMHIQAKDPFSSITGSDPKLAASLEAARKAAHANMPVHLMGEPGSGKEMMAQAIHFSGSKAAEPFVAMNCSVVPESLLEMELFGYGNDSQTGKLNQAWGGTLFIGDIDKLPAPLRDRLFASTEHVRLITASSSPIVLDQTMAITIDIPPLRNRKEDILPLVETFLKEFSAKYNKPMDTISPDAALMLTEHEWPGNVRELRNVIERCVLLGDGPVLTKKHLPEDMARPAKTDEAAAIEQALQKTYGNKSAAATLLGISRGTLYNKMKEYGL